MTELDKLTPQQLAQRVTELREMAECMLENLIDAYLGSLPVTADADEIDNVADDVIQHCQDVISDVQDWRAAALALAKAKSEPLLP